MNGNPMLDCWPVTKVIYRNDGTKTKNLVTGSEVWKFSNQSQQSGLNKPIVNETFSDVFVASVFIWNEIQKKTSHVINLAYLEITFTDGTQLIEHIPVSNKITGAQVSNPKYLLSILIKEKLLKQFHENMKNRLPIASDHFLEEFTHCTAMLVPPEIRKMFDPKISIIDATINLFETECQKIYGKVILENDASEDHIEFDNSIIIRVGDTVEVEKKHMMGFILHPRGLVLSIHEDKRAFRVRTKEGITMFRFQDLKFIGVTK